MRGSKVPGNIINAMRGFAETKGRARQTEEIDTGINTGGRGPTRTAAVACLLRATASGAVNVEKPVIKFDDHSDGDFQF